METHDILLPSLPEDCFGSDVGVDAARLTVEANLQVHRSVIHEGHGAKEEGCLVQVLYMSRDSVLQGLEQGSENFLRDQGQSCHKVPGQEQEWVILLRALLPSHVLDPPGLPPDAGLLRNRQALARLNAAWQLLACARRRHAPHRWRGGGG